MEILYVCRQTIHRIDLNSGIQFIGGFPANLIIGITANIHRPRIIIQLSTPVYFPVGIIHIHLRQIVKAVLIITNRIVTRHTICCFQFKLTENILCRSKELLIRKHPSDGNRGEESPTIVFGKTLGTVITKVELCKIAAIVIISQTSGQTDITVGQRKLQIVCNT